MYPPCATQITEQDIPHIIAPRPIIIQTSALGISAPKITTKPAEEKDK